MSKLSVLLSALIVSALLLCGAAAAYNVTDSTVTNTNVYAGSSVSFISPPGTYDPLSCTTEDMTSDSNIYVRPVDFTATISNSVDAFFKTGVQGAQITLDGGTVVQTPFVWDFGIGSEISTSSPEAKYTYPTGEYTATVTVSNYLDKNGESASFPVSILYGGYESFQGGFIAVLSLIIVAALIGAVILLIVFIRGGADLSILIPFALGTLGLVIVLTIVVFVAGYFDNMTMGLLSGGI